MDQIFSGTISGIMLLNFFFKAFAIGFSGIYVLYAIILTKQTQELNGDLNAPGIGGLLYFGSLSQIGIGIILLIVAITVL